MTRWTGVLMVVSVLCGSAAHGVDISSCGQTVPARDFGVLVNDLVCSDTAVLLENHADLDLAGFSITVTGPGPAIAVHCLGTRCTVRDSTLGPPAQILCTDGTAGGIVANAGPVAKVVLHTVHIDGCQHNVQAVFARVRAIDVVVSNATQTGMIADRLYLNSVTATGNANGLYGTDVVKIAVATVTDNAGYGIASEGKVKGTTLTATGNGLGVSGEHVKLFASTVTGNTLDVVSRERKPRLSGSTCDTSSDAASGGTPWGVCALD